MPGVTVDNDSDSASVSQHLCIFGLYGAIQMLLLLLLLLLLL